MCADIREGLIVLNTVLGRRKSKNMDRDPRVALSWCDPDGPDGHILIRGRVVARYTGERADADIESIAQRYVGRSHKFKPEEQRVTYLIEPYHSFYRPSRGRMEPGPPR
jgi:hypothetical protein